MLQQLQNQYLYTVNYSKDEEALCKMEIHYLFDLVLEGKYFFSNSYIDPSRSPYLKKCINIMYQGDSMADIINQIGKTQLCGVKYKVSYIDVLENELGFKDRRKAEYEIGYSIIGEFEMKCPQTNFGVTKLKDKWIFGKLTSNDSEWMTHNQKPYSYSNALKVNVSRALVNIAVGNNLECSLIDPCCGIGTVLIEALSMGIDIKGYEINPSIGYNAKKNLEYFYFEDIITIGDMHTITSKFDVAILDLPYGLFTSITPEDQLALIKSTRKIASRMVLITFVDMEEQIVASGFNIETKCILPKGTFERHVFVCV